ncbi:S9 family peptidase [Aureibaculum sp. A20]|uniref:prolyl oligopeptidase n=1 Tax=Aureibaculum flavum TaxID=2795986 RepID=A0ABS0WR34_9FLAO|nr:prolyl oligopeptidase family serine peptidase [Aureibaculum flavum]MBJ2174444.1 S9 family peptidase [Aureibaculum flavum]
MKIFKKVFFLLHIVTTSILYAQIEYPETEKRPVIDSYHNVEIIDNYQWLEKTGNPEVENWVGAQNKVSLKYLNRLPNTVRSKLKIAEYYRFKMNYDSLATVKKNNNFYYRLMYPSKNAPLSVYYAKGNTYNYNKLVDPSSISKKDRIIFTNLTPSADDRFLAYQYNRNGSDWKEIKIVGIKNRHFFKETLTEIISPQIRWYGQGFFYIKYKYNTENVKRIFPEIKYHTLGTEQSEDKTIFNVNNEQESLSIYGTNNQSLYIIKKSDDFKKQHSYYYLKPNVDKKEFNPLFSNIKYDINIIHFESDTIVALTSIKNKKHLIKFPFDKPAQWTLLTPSYKDAIFTDYEFADKKIVTAFQSENSSILTVTNLKGKVLGEVITPNGMSVTKLFYNENNKNFTFRLSSYTVPPVTCQLDLTKYKFKYLGKTNVSFDASKYKFIRKKITSHDGVKVPIFIVFKDTLLKNGKTPFLLETYGGYGTIAKPSFDPGVIYFIERGGAYVYVHIRGGGEFGFDWWQDGRKFKKKNGILDFTKAAEYLIDEGYAKPSGIGIMGSSHGGLITAAAMLEKPNLFGAAVINVGALDMLRMERTEVGAKYVNVNEFGTVKKKDEFLNILSYSPFHNIDETVNYPSTLIVTGKNDTRVPPYQSYKFAAKLQNGLHQMNPILLWSQDKLGHYGANQYNSILQESSFIYNFLFNELTH